MPEERCWKILLVDDDEDEYFIVRQMLLDSRARKSQVEWASGYEAGQQAMQSGGYDAVLIDYDLGAKNGLGLIRESTARGDNLPLILFTARGSYDIDFEAMQAGATLYLTKNEANPLLLERAIRYAIERKHAEQALAQANALLTQQKQELEHKNTQLVQALLTLHERETGLRQSENMFRALFNGMTEGFALHEILCDPDGHPCDYRFLEMNPSFERLTGLKREDILGRLKTEVLPGDDAYWIEIYGKVALTGQPIHFTNYSSALKQYYDVYSYCPTPGQFATLFLNITERKEMEDFLRAREKQLNENLSKYAVLFNAFPMGITVSNREGKILETNEEASRLLNLPKDEHEKRKIDSEDWYVIRRDGSRMLPEEYPSVQALTNNCRISNVEMGIVKGPEDVLWLSVTSTPIPLEGYGVVVAYGDITDRVRAEENASENRRRLEQFNQELREFVALAAHDLQEPLRKISGFANRLIKKPGLKLDEESSDYLHRIHSAAVRMQAQIDHLIDYAKVSTGTTSYEAVDLQLVVHEVLEDLEYRIEQSQARVSVGRLPTLNANPWQMRQLLQNLISNALKFCRPGVAPEIKISARQLPAAGLDPAQVQILIEDNGIGIEPDQHPLLFHPFQRLVSQQQYEGSGIGLAICRKVVERHNGSITAESQPGRGSTFIVNLPAAE